MTMGVTDSVVTVNRILGAESMQDSPASSTQMKLKSRNLHYRKRKKLVALRSSKFAASKGTINHDGKFRGYQSSVQDPIVHLDHSYT